MTYYLYNDITTEIETTDGIYRRNERVYLVEYYLSPSKPIVTPTLNRHEVMVFRSEEEVKDIASIIGFKYKHTPPGFFDDGETKVYKCTCGAKYWSMDNYKEHLTNCFEE